MTWLLELWERRRYQLVFSAIFYLGLGVWGWAHLGLRFAAPWFLVGAMMSVFALGAALRFRHSRTRLYRALLENPAPDLAPRVARYASLEVQFLFAVLVDDAGSDARALDSASRRMRVKLATDALRLRIRKEFLGMASSGDV